MARRTRSRSSARLPGYDRHFAITEALGIRMIPVPYLDDGPLDLACDRAHLDDSARARHVARADVREPDGRRSTTSERPGSCGHAGRRGRFPPLLGQRLRGPPPHRRRAAHPSTCSGSRPRPATPTGRSCSRRRRRSPCGSRGLVLRRSARRTSPGTARTPSVQTIGPDKVNQLRHARFFGSTRRVCGSTCAGTATCSRPKFAIVDRILTRAAHRPRHLDLADSAATS